MAKRPSTVLNRPALDRSQTNAFVARAAETLSRKNDIQKPPTLPPPSIEGVWVGRNFDESKDEETAAVTEASPATTTDPSPESREHILALASKLSASDRRQLLAELALAEQQSRVKPGDDRDQAMWTEGVYSALHRAIGQQGGAGAGPLPLRRMMSAPANWEPVREFMMQSALQKLSVPRRQAVYMMLGELLVDHALGVARFSGVPLSARFVANCAARLPHIFDAAFPGYLRAGLASVIAAQLTAHRQQ